MNSNNRVRNTRKKQRNHSVKQTRKVGGEVTSKPFYKPFEDTFNITYKNATVSKTLNLNRVRYPPKPKIEGGERTDYGFREKLPDNFKTEKEGKKTYFKNASTLIQEKDKSSY